MFSVLSIYFLGFKTLVPLKLKHFFNKYVGLIFLPRCQRTSSVRAVFLEEHAKTSNANFVKIYSANSCPVFFNDLMERSATFRSDIF